jgi:PAS domain S-box-containing protein
MRGVAKAGSIRRKLNVIVTATTFFALLLAGLAVVVFDVRNQITTLRNDLVAQADIVALASTSALAFDDPKVARENLGILRARPSIVDAAIYNAQGMLFASYHSGEFDGGPAPARALPTGVTLDSDWVVVSRPVVSNRDTIGTVYLRARHELLPRVLEYLGALTAIFLTSLGAALLLSNRLQARLVRPVLAISDVAGQVMNSRDFNLRAPRLSDDEVGSLADAFNAMLQELGKRAETLEQANRALRESDERYQLAVRGSSAGLWDWDMAGEAIVFSPRVREMLGYTLDEFPDRASSIRNVLHREDQQAVRDTLRAHLAGRSAYQVECRLLTRSGEWRWFMVAGMALRDEAGKPYRMAGSMVDITERKAAEQTLHEASRAKDEFIATLAHELRNPLAPIRTGLEILKKDAGNGPPSQRAREIIERQLVHMIRLIDDLLDISRITSGKIWLERRRMPLRTVIESAIETSRPAVEAGRHELAVDLAPDEIQVEADFTRLAQSVANLLNNAAKYTPAGGRILLQVRREGGQALIRVQDNGVGIPADMLERVFQLFAQVGRTIDRSQGGLGIGLSLVRSLVELHGGTVTAESAGANQGSTFTIRVPCIAAAAPAPAAATASVAAAAGPRAGLRVLLADDNVDAADTMSAMLEMSGHEVRTVYSGRAVLQEAPAFAPEVMLLDIGMPGMSGYEVAQRLRADPHYERTVLVALTGWGSESDRAQALDAGFDHHLTKPVDHLVLERLLRQLAPGSSELPAA